MTHFYWFIAGMVAAALGFFASGFYLERQRDAALTPRRRELFRMVRTELDNARMCALELGLVVIKARLDVLRLADIQQVATSSSDVVYYAQEIGRLSNIIPNTTRMAQLHVHIQRALFTLATLGITFVYKDESL